MAVATRRILPSNAANVRSQLQDIERRVKTDMLGVGDRGDAVADLQRRLRSFGFKPGPADGVFGPQTEQALRSFQRQAGITVDGRAGMETLNAMRKHTAFVQDGFETAAKQGQRGADIKRAERMLKDLGMNPGKVDGVFDKSTAEAVRTFTSRDPQLSEKARIDAETFARMRTRYKKPLEQGANTAGVRQLEKNLKALGRNPGDVDRNYTADTARAVRNFQKKNGLEATGVADLKTRKAIQKAVDALPPPVDQQIASFGKNEPKHDYRRQVVSADGDVLNKRTVAMMDRAEYIMRNKFGHKNFNFSVIQGSYSGTVAASGSTHDKGGAIDIHTRSYDKKTVDDMVKALRMAGFAAWSRGRGADSFDPHIHAIAIGDRELHPSAANQVQEYFNGGDGLVGSRPDPDRHLGRPVPAWARKYDR